MRRQLLLLYFLVPTVIRNFEPRNFRNTKKNAIIVAIILLVLGGAPVLLFGGG